MTSCSLIWHTYCTCTCPCHTYIVHVHVGLAVCLYRTFFELSGVCRHFGDTRQLIKHYPGYQLSPQVNVNDGDTVTGRFASVASASRDVLRVVLFCDQLIHLHIIIHHWRFYCCCFRRSSSSTMHTTMRLVPLIRLLNAAPSLPRARSIPYTSSPSLLKNSNMSDNEQKKMTEQKLKEQLQLKLGVDKEDRPRSLFLYDGP
jgi:hypothetical protein